MVQMNQFAGQKLRHRCREQTYGHQGGKPVEGGGGGVMNWEIGIDMYTLMCIKWMTNNNLLYKKINKIKFKKKKSILRTRKKLFLTKVTFGVDWLFLGDMFLRSFSSGIFHVFPLAFISRSRTYSHSHL